MVMLSDSASAQCAAGEAPMMPCYACAAPGPSGYRCALPRGHVSKKHRALSTGAEGEPDVIEWETP
jgi:hypothetical protein